MRRILATLLLLAVGLSLPAVGGVAQICLHVWSQSGQDECCADCGDAPLDPEPCCVELKELPDAQVPAPTPGLPAVPVLDRGWQAVLPAVDLAAPLRGERLETPIRGPTSPAGRRSVLAIWRL